MIPEVVGGAALVRLVARFVTGKPSALGRAATVAALRTLELLAGLVGSGAVGDFEELRKGVMLQAQVEGAVSAAEAQKRVAEAISATNRARDSRHKRSSLDTKEQIDAMHELQMALRTLHDKGGRVTVDVAKVKSAANNAAIVVTAAELLPKSKLAERKRTLLSKIRKHGRF